MAGVIVEILVAVGDQVTRGQDICILEAMKMQQRLKSPADGVVKTINATPTQRVAPGEMLIEIGAAE